MSAERVRWLRDQAIRLHKMADGMTAQANELEAEMADRPLMTGQEQRDLAVVVLLFKGGDGMHYRDLLVAVEDEGQKRIRGVNPAATFLANLHRDERIVSCGRRTGRYKLAERG
jgi:hypothetical protein